MSDKKLFIDDIYVCAVKIDGQLVYEEESKEEEECT